jgi:ankyrin repeat protein
MSSQTAPVEQLVACVEAGDEAGVETLVGRHPGVVNVLRGASEERTALFVAARAKRARMVRLLHRCGAVLEIVNDIGRTAVHYAAIGTPDDSEAMDALIKAGANGNRSDSYGFMPLHLACQHGNVKIAKYLARNVSTDVFSPTLGGQTAAILARDASVGASLPELVFARVGAKVRLVCSHSMLLVNVVRVDGDRTA